MSKLVRVMALTAFSIPFAGAIHTGNPNHPDEEGRFPHVPEELADSLEDAGQAKRYSLKDQLRDELAAEQEGDNGESDNGGEDDGLENGSDAANASEGGGAAANPRTKDVAGGASKVAAKSAGKVRADRVERNARRGGRKATGQTDTTATTNQPSKSNNSDGTSDAANAGSNPPDPDAAP